MTDSHFLAESPEAVGIDPDKLDTLLARAEREVREGLMPSMQIAVARRGKIAAARTIGRARRGGHDVAATDDTLYHVFSCTKAITSAAAWLLIEEGKLDIDARVVDLVPEFGTHGKDAITVEQLFTHTAGFPRAPFSPPQFLDPVARRARFAEWRLNWAPGTRFEYHPSSSMYVIADIIERASGRSYHEFVRERITRPLGLADTWLGLPPAEHARVADVEHFGAEPTDEEYAALGIPKPPVTEVTEQALEAFNRPEFRAAGIPGGGATMTAADLALFYQALLTGRAHDGAQVWRPETLEHARRVRTEGLRDAINDAPASRGLGLIVAGDESRTVRGFGHTNSPLAFGHGGAGGQLAWADPATGISIGYVTNGHDRNPLRRARRGIGLSSRAAVCALEDERPVRASAAPA